jgi:hypothetical protein
MKLIITAKDNDLDKSVDEVIRIAEMIKGFEWVDCECKEDGTSLILEK